MATGTTLGTAYVQIVPSAQGIKGAITNALDPEAKAAGSSAGMSIGQYAKKAFIKLGVGALLYKGIKSTFDEGAKLQQSYLGGLDTLYGEAADSARAYAREAAAAGISMNDYSEQAVSFGAALKNAYGGDTYKAMEAANTAILDMADNSAKMGTDIQSVQMAYQGFAKQNYTMLDNLKLGYGGTKTEMERLLADAEKLTGVHYDINNLGDVYDAIHAIQGDLGLTGVAADEAATTFSGSFNAMRASAQNFLGSLALGENVQPALTSLVSSVGTFLFNNLIPMVGTIVKALPGAIITFIREGLPMLASGVGGLLTELINQLKTTADNISAKKVSEWITTMLPKMLKAATDIIGKLASGFITNLPKIVSAIARIGAEIVKGLGSAIWGKVTSAAAGIRDRFLAPINALRDKVKGIIDRIKGFFSFHVSAPHIPLPHFSIRPSGWKLGDLLKGSIPSLGIDWYDKGGIFTSPSVIGVAERRPEFVGALDDLRDIVREESSGDNITINVYASDGMDVKALAAEVERRLITSTKRRQVAWQ